MTEVVFQVFQVFYTKPRKNRRKALKTMIKWCVKEYLNTFKKDDDYTLNVMTDEVTKIHD
jgi:hypothetical protein